jgi:hypothetical protein
LGYSVGALVSCSCCSKHLKPVIFCIFWFFHAKLQIHSNKANNNKIRAVLTDGSQILQKLTNHHLRDNSGIFQTSHSFANSAEIAKCHWRRNSGIFQTSHSFANSAEIAKHHLRRQFQHFPNLSQFREFCRTCETALLTLAPNQQKCKGLSIFFVNRSFLASSSD